MKADRDIFGPRLRRERERRGITLKDIADSTKIKESLFAELERGDFSKWPQGIFRRAHLCAYVSAIGLPSQPILAEFLRLFPEENPPDQPVHLKPNASIEAPIARPEASPAAAHARPAPQLADRTWIACFDLAAICLMTSIVSGVLGMRLLSTFALVGLGYFLVGSAWLGQTIGTDVLSRIRALVRSRHVPLAVLAPLREVTRRVVHDREDATTDRKDTADAGNEMNQESEVQERRASA